MYIREGGSPGGSFGAPSSPTAGSGAPGGFTRPGGPGHMGGLGMAGAGAPRLGDQPSMGPAPSAPPGGGPPACASCGKPTEHIEQYDRYYCHGCGEYAPEDAGPAEPAPDHSAYTPPRTESAAPGHKPRSQLGSRPSTQPEAKSDAHSQPPATVGSPLPKPITTSSMSDSMEVSAGKQTSASPSTSTSSSAPSSSGPSGETCRSCGKPATYVEQYDRHYCYDCSEYV